MTAKVVTRRDELGRLWLPWCVDARDPTLPIVDLPARNVNATQLRLTDLHNEVVQVALARQPTPSGTNSWPKITAIATGFRETATGIVIREEPPNQPTVMAFEDFEMLCEGCHRASALWISGISSFELHLGIAEPNWVDYRAAELRMRGRPFRGTGQER